MAFHNTAFARFSLVFGALCLVAACSGGESGGGGQAVVDSGSSSGGTIDSNIFGDKDTGASSGGASSGGASSGGASSSGADMGTSGASVDAGNTSSGGAVDAGTSSGGSSGSSGSSGATDAGSAVIDAGATSSSGAVHDAGTTTNDAGPTAVDSGPAPIDAGPAPVDAGAVTIDAGQPQIDAGAPPVDAGPAGNPKLVRFVALGDTGTGSEKQYKVGKQLAAKCKAAGCDFVLLLGDNFYDVGVDSENDKQFKTKFEDPYKDVNAPFFITLGNHDYGGGGTGGEFMKKEHYIKYAKKNPKFVLPQAFWHKTFKHVHLFSFDSNAMMFSDLFKGLTDDQVKAMKPAITGSKSDWKITFSHHPYLSNGPHGNAGCYEGVKMFTPLLCGTVPILSGKGVKDAFDDMICGKSDVHFSGHDHTFQWLKKADSTKKCAGVELIVAGSGAKTTKVYKKNEGGLIVNPVHYQNADIPGFLYVVIDGNKFSGEFIDMDGKTLFSRSFTK